MKHTQMYEEFQTELKETATAKAAALDFVEQRGEASWKEIHTFLMTNKGYDPNDRDNRGNLSSYFSGNVGSPASKDPKTGRGPKTHGLLMIPTAKDPRYLEKQQDGKYVVKQWDGKSKLG